MDSPLDSVKLALPSIVPSDFTNRPWIESWLVPLASVSRFDHVTR